MNEAISRFLATRGFAPQGGTEGWEIATFWTILSADALLAVALLALGASLFLLTVDRDFRYRWAAGLAGVFFLASAIEQAADLWTALHPAGGFGAALAAFATLAAAVTAAGVWTLGRRLTAAPRRAASGQFSPGLEREIAERRRVEAQLIQAREEALAANRAKTEFLAHMSHELRTPLNAILGFSQVIADDLLGPSSKRKYIEYIHDIQSSGEHLLGIVNELLEISRIETGKVSLKETEVDPCTVAADAARMMSGRAAEAGIALTVDIPKRTPLLIADARMVKQMLLNLLSNAIKYTPNGGTVRVAAGLAADGGVTFSVSDTGVGMPAEEIPRALEPFGQVDANRPRRHGAGFGLGLPICNALAKLHDARLALESTVGRGMTARIEFPPGRTRLQALAG